MYFLFDTCTHPDILRVLYFVYLLLDIVFVAIPIGLVVMLMIDFSKAVIISNEKEQIKSTKLVIKRIMYAVFIFVMPWIVNVLMDFLGAIGLDIGGDYNVCITNVNEIKSGTKTFEYYDELYAKNEEIEGSKVSSGNNTNQVAYGSSFKSAASAMIGLAKTEIGHVGGNKYSGQSDSTPWCAYFVKYILSKTTIEGKGTVLNYITNGKNIGGCGGSCAGDLTSVFENHQDLSFEKSNYYGGDYTPKKGDIIFFWYSNTHEGKYWNKTVSDASHASHIGFVDYVKDGKVYTIEGNIGGNGSAKNKVGESTYSLSNSSIMAYGVWYE